MKQRLGFVSNSSSSSFLIYGYCIDDSEEIKQLAEKLGVEYCEGEEWETLEEIAKKLDLEYVMGEEGYNQYLGKSWDSIKDNQTGAEFKKEIQDKINKAFDEKKECTTHQEAWRDG